VTTDVRYLADTSAIVHLVHPEVAAVLSPLVQAGQVATCGVIDLELFALVADPTELGEIRATRALAFPWLTTTDKDFRRALEAQALLAAEGQRVSWQALVVAAVAERHQVVVLHCNSEFEHIAKVMGVCVEGIRAE